MTPVDDDDAFIASTLAALRAESTAVQEARLEDTLRAAPRPAAAPAAARTTRTRRPAVRYALTALAAGLLAAAITFAATRPSEPVPRDDAFALDGTPAGPGRPGSPIVIATDAQGRPTEIVRRVADRLDGERVLFRAGQVIRIEHYRDGQLDGPQLDFDGLGRLVALRTYAAGALRGPYLELAPDGSVRASGSR